MTQSWSQELRELSKAAEGGDVQSGELLLRLFASLADEAHSESKKIPL